MKNFNIKDLIYIIGIGITISNFYFRLENRLNILEKEILYLNKNQEIWIKHISITKE